MDISKLEIEIQVVEAGYYDCSHTIIVTLKHDGLIISEDRAYLSEITSNMDSRYVRDHGDY